MDGGIGSAWWHGSWAWNSRFLWDRCSPTDPRIWPTLCATVDGLADCGSGRRGDGEQLEGVPHVGLLRAGDDPPVLGQGREDGLDVLDKPTTTDASEPAL